MNYSEIILNSLENKEFVTSDDFQISKSTLHGILLSLESKNQITFEITEKFARVLTKEGHSIIENGSPEYNLFQAVPNSGCGIEILKMHPLGVNPAFKKGWITGTKEFVNKKIETVKDETVELLKNLDQISENQFNELKKRKFVESIKSNFYIIKKGIEYGNKEDTEVELTEEHIANFQNQKFKKYNFNSTGNIPQVGSLHPLMKIKEEVRNIFLEMGFNEMNTNRYVESSFWNFDSLFQPQCHPARDAHDTFFLKVPHLSVEHDQNYLENVKKIHENGGFGSIGHESNWDVNESRKNILRTHTTAVSSRYLKDIAKDFKPVKLFSIDKVFRNESVDATHLAEFHQVEGLIAGYDLSLGDLMGFMDSFFKKLGLKDLKFKPAFNPYTEPSMEVFGFHEGLNKWIEIGNSGIFRPEMLRPMGFDEDVVVIAWGLSLERPAMIKYGLNNIRDLVGHKVDINFIKKCEFIYF